MKNAKKVLALLLAILMVVSLAACSGGKASKDPSGGDSQGKVNASNEIFDFKIGIYGAVYTMPAELDAFKANGWVYANNENPESKEVKANGYATCDVLKDGKRITLTVINLSASTKTFAQCKVGSIDCTFSAANDVTLNLAKKLSVSKKTTVKDVTDKFGEPTKNIASESGTTLRYEKATYIYYVFTFNADGALTYVDIRNWNAEEDSSDNSEETLDLSFLDAYETPTALTEDYADFIFRLEGDLYQLPAPVSVFTENGWTLVSCPDSIPAGNELVSGLKMKKGETELSFSVKNFATGPVETKDAMVTGAYINSEFLDAIDFEVSGGIAFGLEEEAFKEKPFAAQFTSGASVTGGTEYSHFEPSKRMYLTFKDGKLVNVNFTKNRLNK